MGRDDFWEDDEDPIFKIMKDMIRKMEKLFGDMGIYDDMFKGKPSIKGFSITIGPDGEPKIREFGPKPADSLAPSNIGEEKNVIKPDIIDKDDEIIVVFDLPGVNRDSIKLKLDGSRLLVKADGAKRIYEYIELPTKVKGKIDHYEYNNGVLMIHIKKKKGISFF